MTHHHKKKVDLSWIFGDWNQEEWIDRLWVGAWFGISIWTISTGVLNYALFSILLALRIVAPRHKSRMHWLSGLFSPDLLVSIVLTIYSFLVLDRATNFTAWQTLTGLSLAGTIISGLTIVYKFLRMGLLDDSPVKAKPVTSSLYANLVWTLAWFGVAIWIISTNPLYAVSALLLVIRLGQNNKTWMRWAQSVLVSVAILVYIVLVENHAGSPWIGLVVLASIGLAIDALFGLRYSFLKIAVNVPKMEGAFGITLSGSEMKTPPSGLKRK